MNTMTIQEFKAHQKQLGGFHIVPHREVKKSFSGKYAYAPTVPGEDFATCAMARSVDADYVQFFSDLIACSTPASRADFVCDYQKVFPEQSIYMMLKNVLENMECTAARMYLSSLTSAAPEFSWAERTLELVS